MPGTQVTSSARGWNHAACRAMWLSSFIVSFLATAMAQFTNPADVSALRDFNAWTGNRLKWSIDQDPCGEPTCGNSNLFQGFHVPMCNYPELCCEGFNVTGLLLNRYGLGGHLPANLTQLANLEVLLMRSNSIVGSVPAWSGWSSLQTIDLSHNSLTGPLPAAWANNTRLQDIWLGSNQLNGPLPAAWGALSQLQQLDLSNTGVSGAMPQSWAGMKSIQYLDISGDCQVCGINTFNVTSGMITTIAIGGSSYGLNCGSVNCAAKYGMQMNIVRAVVAIISAIFGIILLQQLYIRIRPHVVAWLYGRNGRDGAGGTSAGPSPVPAIALSRITLLTMSQDPHGIYNQPLPLPKDTVVIVQPDGQQVCLGNKLGDQIPTHYVLDVYSGSTMPDGPDCTADHSCSADCGGGGTDGWTSGGNTGGDGVTLDGAVTGGTGAVQERHAVHERDAAESAAGGLEVQGGVCAEVDSKPPAMHPQGQRPQQQELQQQSQVQGPPVAASASLEGGGGGVEATPVRVSVSGGGGSDSSSHAAPRYNEGSVSGSATSSSLVQSVEDMSSSSLRAEHAVSSASHLLAGVHGDSSDVGKNL